MTREYAIAANAGGVGTDVYWLGANKPAYKLAPGFLEHPRLSPRAVIGPGARFLDFLFTGPHADDAAQRRKRWSCCIDDVAVSTFTRRRWSPAVSV
jgi:hypothetical protein